MPVQGPLHEYERIRCDQPEVGVARATLLYDGSPIDPAAGLVLATPETRFTLGCARIGLTLDGGASLPDVNPITSRATCNS